MLFGNYEKLIDITPLVSEELAVFPGDTTYQRNILMDLNKGHHFSLSSIKTTVHLGAHTDAPNHYHADGIGIHERDPKIYLGPATVIELELKRGERISPQHIKKDQTFSSRVLFKTLSFLNPNQWNDDFNALSAELIEFLAEKSVQLVGIDTPSIDLANDKELLSHHAVYKNDMAILEGIVLDQVKAGEYFLVALPLKLKDADASPVRAVLLQ